MRQDAQQNRERILAAAEQVFGEGGAAASTEEVARRAGVGIGTVFRHFPTKNDLIEAVLVRHFIDLADRARALGSAGPPGEALRALIRVMIETGPTKIALLSLAADRDQITGSVHAASQDLRAAVEEALRRAQESGEVHGEVTIDEVYFLVRSLAQASAATRVPARVLNRAADIVLAGLASTVRD